jgi:hypothetical protein
MNKTIVKVKPPKSWWVGDERVDVLMKPFSKVLDKYVEKSDTWTEIYNSAYEATYKALILKK